MPEPTQRSRRPRLLLLALGVGAGLGIALAVGSPAHADDKPVADTIHAVVQFPGRILTDQPAASDQPEPVRDLVGQVLDDTATVAHDATKAIDEAASSAPVAGRAVDEATDVADAVVEAVTSPEPRSAPTAEPTPADTPTAAPTAGQAATPATEPAEDQPTPDVTTGGAQTAPEPAPAGTPVPDDAGSGAPTLAVQHPDAHTTTVGSERDALPAARSQVTRREHTQPADVALAKRRGPRISPGDDHASQLAAGSLRTLDHTAGPGRFPGQPRWEHPHTGHHTQHHDGRTQPPSPPPG